MKERAFEAVVSCFCFLSLSGARNRTLIQDSLFPQRSRSLLVLSSLVSTAELGSTVLLSRVLARHVLVLSHSTLSLAFVLPPLASNSSAQLGKPFTPLFASVSIVLALEPSSRSAEPLFRRMKKRGFRKVDLSFPPNLPLSSSTSSLSSPEMSDNALGSPDPRFARSLSDAARKVDRIVRSGESESRSRVKKNGTDERGERKR